MRRIETHRGYLIFIPKGYKKRMFIDGSGISCNDYFYSIDKARFAIDFAIKHKRS